MLHIYNISIFSFCFLSTFLICWSRLYLYIGPSFIYRIMVTHTFFLNIFFFIFFYIIIYLFLAATDDQMSVFYLADKNNNINVGENTTVNINSTGGQLSLPINHLNKTAAAISATGGASAGIQVAKYVAGPPAVKLAAGVTTAAAVQLTTTFMSKVLDSDRNNSISKLTMSITSDSNGQNVLNNYPLNLLFEINGLLICSLIFLYIIANIYISKYIISKDLTKYIPQNNKMGKLFFFFLSRYLNLWNKSSSYLLGFCYVMLLFCIIICKFGLYLILL
uniref:Uncharacterized protein n=1 Tax=Tolypocladium guangdongense TaxID=2730933 RepID=A0A7S8WWI0_9HYPO|nr:hypothetical protein J6816_mgp26 [Tolypocladium guangdongense]QPF24410.1 hypothetical protein [Tolypocladium guangdongense]